MGGPKSLITKYDRTMFGDAIMKTDRKRAFAIALISVCAVIAIIWAASFFVWLEPLYDNSRFAFYKVGEYDKLFWRWFADDVPQIERDAVAAWFIFGIPITATVTLAPLTLFVKDKIRRYRER